MFYKSINLSGKGNYLPPEFIKLQINQIEFNQTGICKYFQEGAPLP